jgi:hypothetical protein
MAACGAKRTFSAIGTSCDQSRDHDVRPTSEALRSTSSNTTLNWRGPFRPAKLICRRTAGVRSRHRSDLSISAARTRSGTVLTFILRTIVGSEL